MAAVAALALALVLPWTTPFRLGAATAEDAMLFTPYTLLLLGVLALLALHVAQRGDPWLAAFVLWACLGTLRTPTAEALEHATGLALAAFLLIALRALAPPWPARARVALVTLALAQIAYGALQAARWDPLWSGFARLPEPAGTPIVLGTLGNPNYLAAYVALIAPLAPAVLWPLFALSLVLTQSYLGALALAVGLAVRLRRAWWLVVVPALLTGWCLYHARGMRTVGITTRAAVWQLGAVDWLTRAPFVGHGPGSWWPTFPPLSRGLTKGEVFAWAHFDGLQVGYEHGLIGLALLVGWLVAHRAMWSTAYAGSLAALAVESVGFFPFHLATTLGVALVLVALATPRRAPHPGTVLVLDLSRKAVVA